MAETWLVVVKGCDDVPFVIGEARAELMAECVAQPFTKGWYLARSLAEQDPDLTEAIRVWDAGDCGPSLRYEAAIKVEGELDDIERAVGDWWSEPPGGGDPR